MSALAEIRLEEINAKEDLSLRLGDALDVKASIGLALILFLATQTAYFFDKGVSHLGLVLQVLSVFSIIGAAGFAIAELWPRTYVLPQPESDIIPKRIDELTQHYSAYPNVEDNVEQALIGDQIQWAKNRIADNQKKNSRKAAFLNYSFWLSAAGVILNLATLLTLVKWESFKSIF